jgi:hypothetical protein
MDVRFILIAIEIFKSMKIDEILNEKVKYGLGFTGRSDFIESWLFEMPEPHESKVWPSLKNDIQELCQYKPEKLENLGQGLFRLNFQNDVYYWLEIKGEFAIGTSLDKKPYGLFVAVTAKNPIFTNKPPFASDFYLMILANLKGSHSNPNLIMSDKTLSQAGFKNWKRLFNAGHKISVFNYRDPAQTYTQINSGDEMDKFFQSGKEFQNYRYVLSESNDAMWDIWPGFRIRLLRENNGLPLED